MREDIQFHSTPPRNNVAVIGGVVGVIDLLIIAVTVVIVVILLFRNRSERPITQKSTQ